MALVQEDESNALREFDEWIRKACCIGTRAPTFDKDFPFIPFREVQEYLNDDRVNMLLKAVSVDLDLSTRGNLRDNYPRIFCILLVLRKGDLITEFLKQSKLKDCHLPVYSHQLQFRESPEDPDDFDFKENFLKYQWSFVDAADFTLDSTDFEKDRILPFVQSERLGEDGSAVIQKIVLDDAYNHLRPPSSSSQVSGTVTALDYSRSPLA
jgi:hypothetical protein